jgi:MOSC domain-containing protein YiiM
MLRDDDTLARLRGRSAKPGEVAWLGLRPGHREPLRVVGQVRAETNAGLEGDRYRGEGKRQVTLFQMEHLAAIAAFLGREHVDAALLRRNIGIRGLNLLALTGQRFIIGDRAVLEMTGPCHPCSRMEELLGYGGYSAVRGHGGICARVLKGGLIRLGDPIRVLG